MYVVAGDSEASQFVACAVEVMQCIAHDPPCFGIAEHARAIARIQPALDTFVEQLVVALQQQLRQVGSGRVSISLYERFALTPQFIALFFGNAVRLPPCHEVQLTFLSPMRKVSMTNAHLFKGVEEQVNIEHARR